MSRVKKAPTKKVSPAKKAAKKKTTAKKIAKKTVRKTVAAKPRQPPARSEKIRLAEKRKAAVAARTKTLEATQVRVGDIGVVVIDDNDIVAKQKLAKIRRTAVDRIEDPPAATGVALVERVTRAVERELLQIETIVGGHRVKPELRTEAERRARTLASLARTLSEVRRLRAADELQRGADGSSAGASRGPSAARDLDAFRRILSRRLEGMVARTTALPSAGDERGAHWELFAHTHQLPPALAPNGKPWLTWLMIGGRGAGKTRAGAEWVRAQALGEAPFATEAAMRIALVGETEHDVREVMIEGVSGILSVHAPYERPVWLPSRKRLEWNNGAVAQAFSAEDPESLRGPQFSCAWSDEMANWRYAEAAFDMLQFGLRLGSQPRQLITTTPRPTALLKRLMSDPSSAISRAGTIDNANNLAPTFLEGVLRRYAGTRLGRQELDGEIIEDRPDALWSRALLEQCRVSEVPDLQRIVVAVDPPVSSSKRADSCGIVAAGISESGIVYVIADDAVSSVTPAMWANKAIALWRRCEADALLVEINQGGDMVRAVINEVDASLPVNPVRALRGKWLRAEPVATLYEQGRVKHAGAFTALEDEMCDFASSGLSSGRSPDRVDAMVWAVASLALTPRISEPRVRVL